MKKRILGKLLFISLCMMVTAWTPVHATGTGTVLVSYTPGEMEYWLEVQVSGHGQVMDGSQSIRDGILQYTFPEASQKIFQVLPDDGYHIESVQLFNNSQAGIDLKDQLDAGNIMIHVDAVHMKLIVTFEKNTDKPVPIIPSQSGSNTGDSTDQNLLWVWVIGSGIQLVLLSRKKRSDEEYAYKG